MHESTRQLAAIMFTDIVGYTALMGKDSAKALELVRISKEIQKPLVEKHNGKWLKEMGDGAMTQFSSALDAVNCAIEIQRTSRADFEGDLRIGIHLGDITFEENDVYGDGVNVAARLESIADPGGIYISESIEKAIRGQTDIQAKYLGESQLKNVDYGVKTYALQGVGLPYPLISSKQSNKSIFPLSKKIYLLVSTIIILGLLFLLSYFTYQLYFKPSTNTTLQPLYFQIAMPGDMYLAVDTDYPALALSPDGTVLAFVAVDHGRRSLYIRNLKATNIKLIPGSVDATNPFFFTNGTWIGFFKGLTIMKVSTNGGSPIPVFEATPASVHHGITRYRNDSLIFSSGINTGLTIGAAIGEVKHIFTDWKELTARSKNQYWWPCEVAGTNSVLFTEIRSEPEEVVTISILSMEDRSIEKLISGGSYPIYSPIGQILFARSESIFVVPFNPDTKQVTQSEQVLINNLFTSSYNRSAQFAVGGTHLAYITKEDVSESEELVWVDRNGNIDSLKSDRNFDYPRLSPDETWLAVTSYDGPNSDIWLLDLIRNMFTKLTSQTGLNFNPVWSPDGSKLAFASVIAEEKGEDGPGIVIQSLNSANPPKRLFRTPDLGYWEFPTSWSPDGNWMLYTATKGELTGDIMVLNMENYEQTIFEQTPNAEHLAVFSPDGKWIAFVSNHSGRREIYVKPFPGPGVKIQVSVNGGFNPAWAKDGNELFYRQDNKFLVVSVTYDSTLTFSNPEVMFDGPFKRDVTGGGNRNYDVSADGNRFIMIERKNIPKPKVINIIQNWQEMVN